MRRARIGVWGHGVPGRGEAVYSVRQNLTPLVLNGKPTPAAADWSVWGATLGGGEFVARSALGQVAMEVDINPEWVQLDVAGRPDGPLRAAIGGQSRPESLVLRLGQHAVGGLDVLVEATVDPEVLRTGLDAVPDAGTGAEPGRPGQLADDPAGRLEAGLARVKHHDTVRRDGQDPVPVEAEEDENAGQRGQPLARRLSADHRLDGLARPQVLSRRFTHGVTKRHDFSREVAQGN